MVARSVEGARLVDVGGGISAFVRAGSPLNKIVGIGFDGPVDLAAAEAIWEGPVRLEISALAPPEFAPSIAAYQLIGFENLLLRDLATLPARTHDVVSRDDDVWQDVLVDGFSVEDGTGAQVEHFAREAIAQVMTDFRQASGFRGYVCMLDGQPAGAATLRIDNEIAFLAGAATLPSFRRRGVQSALLAARLHEAREAGCRVAVITVAPGSASQKNAMASGFSLGYARAVLQRPERG